MSDNELLAKVLRSRTRHLVDEVWGPLDPHVRSTLSVEFKAAYEAVSRAVYQEVLEKDKGKALIGNFADDPEVICPQEKKLPKGGGGGGGPVEPEPIDRALVGAALVTLSHSIRDEGLAKSTFEAGNGLMRAQPQAGS